MHINTSQILHKDSTTPRISVSRRESIFNKELTMSFFKNKNHFKSRFYSEVAILISSGIDLKKALEIILSGLTKQKEKDILNVVLNKIIKGSTLANALEKTDSFSAYDYFSVKIGEESGSLSSVLKELSNYYSKRIVQTRQVKSALTYPILVLSTTIISLVFMLNFIVPMFEDVFLRFRGTLPSITKTIMALSDSFSKYILYLALILILLVIIHFLNKQKNWYRKLYSSLLIRIPISGPILILTYKARFCQTLKLLVSSKVHLLETLCLIKQMIGFYPIEQALDDIQKKLAKGISFSDALADHSFFDKKLIAMTRVAEEVNKLDLVYDQLFEQYSEELDTKIKTMNNLLEPILILFVGGLVALILISMYMPIFQIGTGIY